MKITQYNIKVSKDDMSFNVYANLDYFPSCCGVKILNAFRWIALNSASGGIHQDMSDDVKAMIYKIVYNLAGCTTVATGGTKVMIADKWRGRGDLDHRFPTFHAFSQCMGIKRGKLTDNYNEETRDWVAEYEYTKDDKGVWEREFNGVAIVDGYTIQVITNNGSRW